MPSDGLTQEEPIRWLQSQLAFERHRGIRTCCHCEGHVTRADKCAGRISAPHGTGGGE